MQKRREKKREIIIIDADISLRMSHCTMSAPDESTYIKKRGKGGTCLSSYFGKMIQLSCTL